MFRENTFYIGVEKGVYRCSESYICTSMYVWGGGRSVYTCSESYICTSIYVCVWEGVYTCSESEHTESEHTESEHMLHMFRENTFYICLERKHSVPRRR
jgi:hypothetical protein